MNSNWLIGLLILEGIAFGGLSIGMERHRIDRNEKLTFWRVLTENTRALSPEYYGQVGKRRLPWLWLVGMMLLLTFVWWTRLQL